MKTIKEACEESFNKPGYSDLFTAGKRRGFKAGVEFTQRWIPVKEELPVAYESGDWDGLRSDFVIAKCKNDYWYKARIYEGFMDGEDFCDWTDQEDYKIKNVVSWRPIERI